MKPVTVPGGEPLDNLPLPPAEQHASAVKAPARLRDEAAADVGRPLALLDQAGGDAAAITIVDQQRAPILIEANLWFQHSELAWLPVVQMRGDSMGETLRDGDFVFVEVEHADASQGGIFAICEKESVFIAQVEMIFESGRSTGRIRCTPRNPHYRPFELTLGDDAENHRARCSKDHPVPVRGANEAAGFARRLLIGPAGLRWWTFLLANAP